MMKVMKRPEMVFPRLLIQLDTLGKRQAKLEKDGYISNPGRWKHINQQMFRVRRLIAQEETT